MEVDHETQWIWLPGDPSPGDSYSWFRTEFDLDHRAELSLQLSADVRYRVWVDGRLIGDGPPLSAPAAVYVDDHRISVEPGRHCLAVVVRCTGVEPGRRAGLLAELRSPNHGVLRATGDERWRCRTADAWAIDTAAFEMNRFEPYQEVFDARREPVGWQQAGFDDSGWERPVPVAAAGDGLPSGQWQTLLPRPIPPMEESEIRPVSLTVEECLWLEPRTRPDLSIRLSQVGRPLNRAQIVDEDHLLNGWGPAVLRCSDDHLRDHTVDGVYDPCVTLDLGRQQTAYIELEVDGPAGAVVDIGVAERLVDGHFNNAIEGQFACRVVLAGRRLRWRSMAWRGFRYLRLRVGRTGPAGEPVVIHSLRVVRTRYRFVDAGSFECADPQLNGVFELCRETVRLCAHESIMDTPWREQAQWLGDVSAVTAPAIRTLFADTALVEKFIDQAARSQHDLGTLASISNGAARPGVRPTQDIPDYTLWWVIDLLEHYDFTGDLELLRRCLPVLRRVLSGFARHRTEYGTAASFGWVFIDWADVDTDGECAALNAIYHGALRSAAEIAERLGATDDHDRWSEEADRLRAGCLERFWSPEDQLFFDAVHPDGTRSTKISEQTNFAAIRFGLIDGEPARRLADRVLRSDRATEAQPFFASVLVDALHRVGRTDRALQLIGDRWGERMLDRGATSCYEEWGINGSWRSGEYAGFLRTESHAWGAHPATFLIKNLIGLQILEPGRSRVRIDPYPGLDYSSSYPTPWGPLRVTVDSSDPERPIITASAPASVQLEAPPSVLITTAPSPGDESAS